jgi:ABC-type lipoprotein release transport system permease subunit
MSFLSNFWHRNARAISVGFFLATRQVRRSSKWTTGLIIFIMILTFLNLVVVSGLLVGLLTGSYEQYRESYSGDVLVTPKPGRTYIENTSGILSYLDNQPEVLGYSARYATTGSVLGDLINNPLSKEKANQSGAGITGFDPEKEEALTNFSRFIIQGESLKTGDDDYILIGKNLIKEYSSFADVDIPGLDLLRNIKPGDKVRVGLDS